MSTPWQGHFFDAHLAIPAICCPQYNTPQACTSQCRGDHWLQVEYGLHKKDSLQDVLFIVATSVPNHYIFVVVCDPSHNYFGGGLGLGGCLGPKPPHCLWWGGTYTTTMFALVWDNCCGCVGAKHHYLCCVLGPTPPLCFCCLVGAKPPLCVWLGPKPQLLSVVVWEPNHHMF